jgi:mannose-6-phosphate isomerase-like protein (cupin superfamily)
MSSSVVVPVSSPVSAPGEAAPLAAEPVKPAVMFRHQAPAARYSQRFLPQTANLQFLSCGEHELPPGAATAPLGAPGQEILLFQWKGHSVVDVAGTKYLLAPYDTLYVPLGAAFQITNRDTEEARLFQLSAPAENVHPVHHARFAEYAKREDRIRHLKGKDVYVMHGEGEGADKLIAGYTLFQPNQRSWPPHNHTDQEEVYIFLKGAGSMEVYESPETMTFVHNVREGDLVSIPFLNYHPVFSQEEPVHFIWCIAGARYWVGDKAKDFMKGGDKPITT